MAEEASKNVEATTVHVVTHCAFCRQPIGDDEDEATVCSTRVALLRCCQAIVHTACLSSRTRVVLEETDEWREHTHRCPTCNAAEPPFMAEEDEADAILPVMQHYIYVESIQEQCFFGLCNRGCEDRIWTDRNVSLFANSMQLHKQSYKVQLAGVRFLQYCRLARENDSLVSSVATSMKYFLDRGDSELLRVTISFLGRVLRGRTCVLAAIELLVTVIDTHTGMALDALNKFICYDDDSTTEFVAGVVAAGGVPMIDTLLSNPQGDYGRALSLAQRICLADVGWEAIANTTIPRAAINLIDNPRVSGSRSKVQRTAMDFLNNFFIPTRHTTQGLALIATAAIVNRITVHYGGGAFLADALCALRTIACERPAVSRCAAEKGVLAVLLRTLRDRDHSSGLTQYASGCLRTFGYDDVLAEEICRQGGVEAILEGMDNFSDDEDVQECGCDALASLAKCIVRGNQKVIVITKILEAMTKHNSSAIVQHDGLLALRCLSAAEASCRGTTKTCDSTSAHQCIVKQGGVPQVIHVLRGSWVFDGESTSSVETLVTNGYMLLHYLANAGVIPQQEHGEARSAVLESLSLHRQSLLVVQEGLLALKELIQTEGFVIDRSFVQSVIQAVFCLGVVSSRNPNTNISTVRDAAIDILQQRPTKRRKLK